MRRMFLFPCITAIISRGAVSGRYTVGGVFAVIGNVTPDVENIRFGKRRETYALTVWTSAHRLSEPEFHGGPVRRRSVRRARPVDSLPRCELPTLGVPHRSSFPQRPVLQGRGAIHPPRLYNRRWKDAC